MEGKNNYPNNKYIEGAASSSEEEGKKEGGISWSDLQPELLSLISSYLFAGEYYNSFRATCKSGRSLSRFLQPLQSLSDFPLLDSPWFMYATSNKYGVAHPISYCSYSMDIPELLDTAIRFSKHEWLLLSQGESRVFFFNPFTKVRIQLPDAPFGKGNQGIMSMCFSAPPTSPNCTVVVFGTFQIGLLRRGEQNWTLHAIPTARVAVFVHAPCSPVLHDGRFYCLGHAGKLGIYECKDNECSWTVFDTILKRRFRNYQQRFILENDGDLLQVLVAHNGRVCVLKLDTSTMGWQEVKNFGNKMIYLSRSGSFSETALVEGTGNKIYFPKLYGDNCVFYSFATHKYHCFADNYCNEELYNTREHTPCTTWIKPNFAKTSHENIYW